MTSPKITSTSRPIKGDDPAWKREKDIQILELQNLVRNLLAAQENQNRR